MRAKQLSLHEAARLLGTTRPALLKSMRDAEYMTGTDPAPELVKAGYFVTEPRSWHLDNGQNRHYQITLVTLQGLAWLDQRINGTGLKKAS